MRLTGKIFDLSSLVGKLEESNVALTGGLNA